MVIHQVVNMRVGYPSWIHDREGRHAWELKAEEVRTDMARRGIRYAVSPGQRHVTAAGLVIEAGKQVTLEHFAGFTDEHKRPIAAWRLLEKAVRECRVLEADLPPEPTSPRAA